MKAELIRRNLLSRKDLMQLYRPPLKKSQVAKNNPFLAKSLVGRGGSGFSNRDIQSAIVRVSNTGQSGKLDGGFLMPPIQNPYMPSSQANLRQLFGPHREGTRNISKEQSQSGLVNKSTKISESNAARQFTSGAGPRGSLKSVGTHQTNEQQRAGGLSAYGIGSFGGSYKAIGIQSSTPADMFAQQMSHGKSQTNFQSLPKSAVLR